MIDHVSEAVRGVDRRLGASLEGKNMEDQPLQQAANGRRPNGTFAPGHKFGRGNGIARKVARFRDRLFRSVTNDEFAEIVEALKKEAKAGQSWAVKLALEYLCGPPEAVDLEIRLTALELTLAERKR
jgi:hypothetical protein